MAQLRASPKILRNRIHDRVIHGSRPSRFLDERRERGRLRGNNDRNDREREV